jgi:ribosomal protein S18 acetylase RimI-like enzyme
MILRKARPDDAAALVRVKSQLPMPQEASAAGGGFLLGTDLAGYASFIAHDIVHVAEDPDLGVVGFAIVLRDATLRASELWAKRGLIDWQAMPPAALDTVPVCYFEQLAVLPEARLRTYAKHLALRSLAEGMRTHTLACATVVAAPVNNLASRPFLRVAGFQLVGQIDEQYPVVGQIRSDVFVLHKAEFLSRLLHGPYAAIASRLLADDGLDSL